MDSTIDHPRVFTPELHRLADQLVGEYKACGAERGRLHLMSYDFDDPNAERALHLLDVPSDDVISIARIVAGGVSVVDAKRYADVLTARLLWSDCLTLVEWLRGEVTCPQVASLIERTDYLRLVLLSILTPTLASKQSA